MNMSNAVPEVPAVGVDVLKGASRVEKIQAVELAGLDEHEATCAVEILPRRRFLQRLRTEKRRTDRSGAPLSLVLLRAPGPGATAPRIDHLLEVLTQTQRETDLIGCLGTDTVALLLTHTDAAGLQAFRRKLAARAGDIPYVVTSGTYPDQIFENVTAAADADPPEASAYLVEDEVSHGPLEVHAKRALDVVGALVLVALFAPVMLATAVAVKASSPGPVIFRQVRLGRRGVPFWFYKFRSMRMNNDDRIHRAYVSSLIAGRHDEVNQGDAAKPAFKIKADPRVTPIGRFIRKTSIDELPQLFNVLKGDMSLVGPRPPIPYEAENYKSWHLRRVLEADPGITGLWQVEGRSRVSFDDMVRLDLRYARTWSLWLDLRILVKTVWVVLRRDGAD